MSLYFLLHQPQMLEGVIRPALAAIYRERSFAPCQRLWQQLRPRLEAFRSESHIGGEPLLCQALKGMTFSQANWRSLVGELLLETAEEAPDVLTVPQTLCWLLGPRRVAGDTPRVNFSFIEQIHFGTQDLVFGRGWYRPDYAGYNDPPDVARIAEWSTSINPTEWTTQMLLDCPGLNGEAERAEELVLARQSFEGLAGLYQSAHARGLVIVCEKI
jgi:hypothetical protein